MLLLTTRKSLPVKAACCGGCASNPGKPCCGGKRPPLPAGPRYERRGGLLLPRRQFIRPGHRLLRSPRALLGWPSEPEWGGRLRPWLPALPTFDMSCTGCCGGCERCDPGEDVATIGFELSGAIELTGGVLNRGGCEQGVWSYGSIVAPTSNCGGEFASVEICVFCDVESEDPSVLKATLIGGGGTCAATFGEIPVSEGWDCRPLAGSFEFETVELLPDGCPCGAGQPIILTVHE